MRKPRTRKDLLDHPYVAKIGTRGCKQIDDILWSEYDEITGRDSYWLTLAEGYNCDGCSCLHEDTIKDLCEAIAYHVVEGQPY